jgi:uncharacterized protein YndB with AHSA1/START domain
MVTVETFPLRSMRIVVEEIVKATPSQVFAALTTGVALWWSAGHLENEKLARDLILEPRLGGRFYETWEQPASDKDGSLLGNVIQIRRAQVIKIAGFFGLEDHCAYGVLSIHLRKHQDEVIVHLCHEAIGNIDDAVQNQMAKSWQELLSALKELVESHHSHGLRSDPALED